MGVPDYGTRLPLLGIYTTRRLVAQRIRASVFDTESCGFKSYRGVYRRASRWATAPRWNRGTGHQAPCGFDSRSFCYMPQWSNWSKIPGSQPGGCGFKSRLRYCPVAQSVEHPSYERLVVGSNPTGAIHIAVAQSGQSTCLGRKGPQVQILPAILRANGDVATPPDCKSGVRVALGVRLPRPQLPLGQMARHAVLVREMLVQIQRG